MQSPIRAAAAAVKVGLTVLRVSIFIELVLNDNKAFKASNPFNPFCKALA
jgi:hypothetical protein